MQFVVALVVDWVAYLASVRFSRVELLYFSWVSYLNVDFKRLIEPLTLRSTQ